jgi:short-subunit dehydrogenase
MATALITGPTAGIGAAFASRLAADGHRLVLVARDEEKLHALAAESTDRHGTPADGKHEVLVADLTDPSALARVEDRLRDRENPVDLLVNNAGIGAVGLFWTVDPVVLRAQHDLGVTAVLRLTRAALEGMVDRGAGAVLNVASFAALLPGRNGAAYTAGKSYVVSLSERIRAELKGTGVSIAVVCPGWTRTELHRRSGNESPAASSKWWLDADEVVRQALADLARGRTRSVPGRRYRVLLRLAETLPRGLTRR